MVRVERTLLMITGLMMEFQNRYSYFGRQKCGLPPKGFLPFVLLRGGETFRTLALTKPRFHLIQVISLRTRKQIRISYNPSISWRALRRLQSKIFSLL